MVERDRRLVVVDTRLGDAPAASGGRGPSLLPRQIQFNGSAELTTRAFYDERAPRTIRLDPGSATVVRWLKPAAGVGIGLAALLAMANPWLLAPLLALADGRVRARLRRATTTWLDRVEREAS